jgi:uncharacterized protein (DUF697 family)
MGTPFCLPVLMMMIKAAIQMIPVLHLEKVYGFSCTHKISIEKAGSLLGDLAASLLHSFISRPIWLF